MTDTIKPSGDPIALMSDVEAIALAMLMGATFYDGTRIGGTYWHIFVDGEHSSIAEPIQADAARKYLAKVIRL